MSAQRAADFDLIRCVLEINEKRSESDSLTLYQTEREVFPKWLERGRELSEKERAWLEKAAERLGVIDSAPSANVFSSWSEERQRTERKRASKYAFENMPRPMRPPARRPNG